MHANWWKYTARGIDRKRARTSLPTSDPCIFMILTIFSFGLNISWLVAYLFFFGRFHLEWHEAIVKFCLLKRANMRSLWPKSLNELELVRRSGVFVAVCMHVYVYIYLMPLLEFETLEWVLCAMHLYRRCMMDVCTQLFFCFFHFCRIFHFKANEHVNFCARLLFTVIASFPYNINGYSFHTGGYCCCFFSHNLLLFH